MATLVDPAAVPKRMTVEEFVRYPWGDLTAELVGGRVRLLPMPSAAHAWVVHNLLYAMWQSPVVAGRGEAHGYGAYFHLPHRPETLRFADLSFVRAGRIPALVTLHEVLRLAPDLAVEVLSPDDTYTDTDEKLDDFLQAGVRAAWLVDLRRRRVTVFVPGEPRRVYAEGATLDGAPVLPGFTMPVAAVFAGIARER